LGQAHNNLGSCYSKLGNYQLSKFHLQESVKYYQMLGDSTAVAGSLTNLGQTLFNLGDYDQGIKCCTSAESILKKANYPSKEMFCYQCLYDNYKGKGKKDKALDYYEKYVRTKDTLFNRQKTEDITRLAVSYEFNKQQELINLEHQRELTIQENEKKNQKKLLMAGSIIVILLVILTVFVVNRLNYSRKQNKLIEQQNIALELKQKEILDSIRYAKRIQQSLLPSELYFLKHLKQKGPKSN
jgi:tetratricopeptide (TPR) repeat protein